MAECTHHEALIHITLTCEDIKKITDTVGVTLTENETRISGYNISGDFVCIQQAKDSKRERSYFFETYESLRSLNGACVPRLILPFMCNGRHILLAYKPNGQDLESFLKDNNRLLDFIKYTGIDGNIRPSLKLQAIIRSLTIGIGMFKDSSFRPSDLLKDRLCSDKSTIFVDENGAIVFTCFVKRNKLLDKDGLAKDAYIEWSSTLSNILDSLVSVFDHHESERKCLSHWLSGFRESLTLKSSEIQRNLLDSNVFYNKEQRIGYCILVRQRIQKWIRDGHGPWPDDFLAKFHDLFRNWQNKAECEPKLYNIQVLNRRRVKEKIDPNWNESDDIDLWMQNDGVSSHDDVYMFIQFVRNSLTHFVENEDSLNKDVNITNNVPYGDVNDLIDKMDSVWPSHFSHIITLGRFLKISPGRIEPLGKRHSAIDLKELV